MREKDVSQKKSTDKNLIKNLNQYCMMPDDLQEKKHIFDTLYKELYSPSLIVSCDFIPSDDKLMRDAIILSDAFESLTNGMSHELALRQLDSIPHDSFLHPWCFFIKSVQSFYAGDHESCLRYIKLIPEDSAAGAFKYFFEFLLEDNSENEIETVWKGLKESVLESNRVIEDSLDLIEESVEIEDLLLESAGLLIRDIIREDRESASKILLWCFDRLQLSDVLSDKAVLKAKQLFGEQDGYRLSSLASLSFDPDRSLVYWLHSLLSYLDCTDTVLINIKAYLSILRDISETVQLEFELTEEYVILINSMISNLSEKIFHIYPELQANKNLPADPFRAIAQLCGRKQPLPLHRNVRELKPVAVQLELFAF